MPSALCRNENALKGEIAGLVAKHELKQREGDVFFLILNRCRLSIGRARLANLFEPNYPATQKMNLTLNKSHYVLAIAVALLANCTTPTNQTASNSAVDTTKFHKLDSIPIAKKVRTAIKDTVLTIKADSVNALYYPNTGKVVMKLKKGDVCKITRVGRYDVIDNKGNFWIRVERMGGKGWIFGGQTSIESDLWVFSEGMTEIGHPYSTFSLNKITGKQFPDFFEKVQKAIQKTELADGDEGGTRKVEIKQDEVIVSDDDGIGSITTEVFKLGPTTDSIHSINYRYSLSGDVKTTFDHTFIAYSDGTKTSLIADFPGELKAIHRIGRDYILAAEYTLTDTNLGAVHYTNLAVVSPKEKSMKRMRYGYSAVETTSFPIFRRWDDGSFVTKATSTFAREGSLLTMQIFEEYNRLNDDDTVTEKVFYITRYYTFNPVTNQFDESKQEVIYLGE